MQKNLNFPKLVLNPNWMMNQDKNDEDQWIKCCKTIQMAHEVHRCKSSTNLRWLFRKRTLYKLNKCKEVRLVNFQHNLVQAMVNQPSNHFQQTSQKDPPQARKPKEIFWFFSAAKFKKLKDTLLLSNLVFPLKKSKKLICTTQQQSLSWM